MTRPRLVARITHWNNFITNCKIGLYLFLVTQFLPCTIIGKRVAMKIVEEPSNYGMNFGANYQETNNAETTLKMRVASSNFSGPAHLRRLYGKCFSKTDESYRYELCPFYNVTQHEQSLRWNPYSGVLGVWQQWEIKNNTFIAMVMREGDSCGQIYRSVRVLLKCGEQSELVSVGEPKTCEYEFIFKTPLVCHPDSLLVYPTLPEELQTEWDRLEGHLANEEITIQGYKKSLRKLFEKAGYYMSKDQEEKQHKSTVKKEELAEREDQGEFASLSKCTKEYKKLKEEVEGLRTLIQLQGISQNHTKNPEEDPDHNPQAVADVPEH